MQIGDAINHLHNNNIRFFRIVDLIPGDELIALALLLLLAVDRVAIGIERARVQLYGFELNCAQPFINKRLQHDN